MSNKIKKIVIHCSDSRFGNALLIDQWHKERGWDGIGYHYVIQNGFPYSHVEYQLPFLDGMIEAGRPDNKTGAHVKGHNTGSIGICLIGKGEKDSFTNAQIRSAIAITLSLMHEHDLTPNDVYGHCELDHNKTCPGLDMNSFRKRLITPNEF